jgi:putative hemolysin
MGYFRPMESSRSERLLEKAIVATGVSKWIVRPLVWISGLRRLEMLYSRVHMLHGENLSAPEFCEAALKILNITYEFPNEQIEKLRQIKGPLLLTANHPFGAIDALVLTVLASRLQRKFHLVANDILTAVPEFTPILIPVDIRDEGPRSTRNLRELRKLLKLLDSGDAAILFPAGEVASFSKWTSRTAVELPWNAHLGRIVERSRATVVPIFFAGRNSDAFQYAGLLFRPLRIFFLAREILRGQYQIRFKIGAPISFAESGHFLNAAERAAFYRSRMQELSLGMELG